MIGRPDPLRDPQPLIRRVYAYAAYRLGDGPEAEDVTSETFERAIRYQDSYDPGRGEPIAWLLGIARRCINGRSPHLSETGAELLDAAAPGDLEEDATRRIMLAAAMEGLPPRERELIALRYGSDLTARQIAEVLETTTSAVEVALHRALARLRERLGVA
jgi:RNA polymerase sigma factor (sigma-70 family)